MVSGWFGLAVVGWCVAFLPLAAGITPLYVSLRQALKAGTSLIEGSHTLGALTDGMLIVPDGDAFGSCSSGRGPLAAFQLPAGAGRPIGFLVAAGQAHVSRWLGRRLLACADFLQ